MRKKVKPSRRINKKKERAKEDEVTGTLLKEWIEISKTKNISDKASEQKDLTTIQKIKEKLRLDKEEEINCEKKKEDRMISKKREDFNELKKKFEIVEGPKVPKKMVIHNRDESWIKVGVGVEMGCDKARKRKFVSTEAERDLEDVYMNKKKERLDNDEPQKISSDTWEGGWSKSESGSDVLGKAGKKNIGRMGSNGILGVFGGGGKGQNKATQIQPILMDMMDDKTPPRTGIPKGKRSNLMKIIGQIKND